MNDQIKAAIEEYKKLYWHELECEVCGTTAGVRYDSNACADICIACLEKSLAEDPEELFESISDE